MKKIVVFAFSLLLCLSLSGCTKAERDYLVKQLKNVKEVSEAGQKDYISKDAALDTIHKVAEISTNKVDPENKIHAVTSAEAIHMNPEAELKKVIDSATAGPASWKAGFLSILGFGAVALGIVGKFLGPPWNIAGAIAGRVGKAFLPDYESNKRAVVGVIHSVETTLDDFGGIIQSLAPETRDALKAKLGMEPVDWLKDKLQRAQVDNGSHVEVGMVMDFLKQNATTKAGQIAATVGEIDDLIAHKVIS